MKSRSVIENIVFEGGGVAGGVYTGAIEVLEQRGYRVNLKRVAGSSAGAIAALMVAMRVPAMTIKNTLQSIDFSRFKDDDFGAARDISRLVNEFGWHKGERLHEFIREIVTDVFGYDATFQELHEAGGLELHVTGCNLSKRRNKIMIFNRFNTPDMKLSLAVKISSTIPIFFAAEVWRRNIMVDGGTLLNFPLHLFDQDGINWKTIGLKTDTGEEIDIHEEEDFDPQTPAEDFNIFTFAESLVSALTWLQSMFIKEEDWKRICQIDSVGVSATDFHISDEKKNEMHESGRDAMNDFLDEIEGKHD